MACTDYGGDWIEALDVGTMAVQDAVLCPYQTTMGGVVFATFVILGLVNIPIYSRQQSVLVPMIVTLSVGGVVLSQVNSLFLGILTVVLLLLFGIGPLLVLRRLQ